MTHADAAERARAHLSFIQARRHMLDAMRGWLALGARADIAQDEADATCSAVRQIVGGVDRIARNGVSSIAETAAKAENANASRRQPEGVTLNQIGAELTRPTGIPNPVLAENLRSVNAGGMPYE